MVYERVRDWTSGRSLPVLNFVKCSPGHPAHARAPLPLQHVFFDVTNVTKFFPFSQLLSKNLAKTLVLAPNMFSCGDWATSYAGARKTANRREGSCYLLQRESLVFDPEKPLPFPLAQSIKLHISVLVVSPCLIPRHRCEKSASLAENLELSPLQHPRKSP